MQMAFKKQTQRKRIEIDRTGVHGDSPEVRIRLERIERNYGALDQILTELESRIKLDDRLAAENGQDDSLPKQPR